MNTDLERIEALERRVEALEALKAPAKNGNGEKLFKAWAQEEAARCGIGVTAIYMRHARGKYPNLWTRRNGRDVYVMA